MSTIMSNWDEEFIRSIILELDKKTGLEGSGLPIKLGRGGWELGHFDPKIDNQHFFFSLRYLNNPMFAERAAVNLIRHEYAHYYVFAAGIRSFFPNVRINSHHGDDWKWACKMVGATPIRCYTPERFADCLCDEEEALSLYLAEDVPMFYIKEYIRTWNQLPLDEASESLWNKWAKARGETVYFEKGNNVFSKQYGFGEVVDTVPIPYEQKVLVRFESKIEKVCMSKELYKIIDGVIRMK